MKFRFAVFCAVFFAAALIARGQNADARYVQIYNMIQEADALAAGSQPRQAIPKYQEAQTALKNLQTTYPGWQEKVVAFRLNYIAGKLDALAPKPAETNAPAATLTNAPVMLEAGADKALQEQLKGMQTEILRLTEENTKLQGKLKEALTVQPAPMDPRELAKAEEQIRELQKQRDLLKAAVEEAQKASQQSGASLSESEKQVLEAVKQRQAKQAELTAQVQKENDELKKQNAALQQQQAIQKQGAAPLPGKSSDLSGQLEVARITMSALQATNTTLRAELLVLQNRLAAITSPSAAAKARPGARNRSVESLEAEIEVLRARLEVYEAQPVPYTADELVLFKKPDANMSLSQTNFGGATNLVPSVKKVLQPPPGTGAMFEEARRAAEAGRFEESEQKFLQVLRQDEKNLSTLSYLIAVQIDLKRYDEAEKNVNHALTLDPQDAAILFSLGRLRYAQEKYDDALDAFSRSASADSNKFLTQYMLGKTLVQKGNRVQAEKALRKAVQLNPRSSEAQYSLAVVYATQQPPFKELAQWHYNKALNAGMAPNPDFEKLLISKPAEAGAK